MMGYEPLRKFTQRSVMAIKKYLVAKPNWTFWWGGWGWAPERKRFRIYPVYISP